LRNQIREAVDIGVELVKLTNNVISRMTMIACAQKFNLAYYKGFCKNLDLQGFDRRLRDLHRRFGENIQSQQKKERKICYIYCLTQLMMSVEKMKLTKETPRLSFSEDRRSNSLKSS